MKLFNHISDFEIPSIWTIFTICCSSRRKFERYEKIIEQEKSKNEYLNFELKTMIQLIIEAYTVILMNEQEILKECLMSYEYAQKQYNLVKELKLVNDVESLQTLVFNDSTIDNVEEDWKKTLELIYDSLEKQTIVFERLEQKIKMFQTKI